MVTWSYLDRDAIVDIREVTQSRKDLKWVIGRDPHDDSAVHFNDYGRLLKALAVWEAIPICGQASHGRQPSGPLRKQVTSRLIMLGVDVGPELMLATLIIFIIKNVNLEHQYLFRNRNRKDACFKWRILCHLKASLNISLRNKPGYDVRILEPEEGILAHFRSLSMFSQ